MQKGFTPIFVLVGTLIIILIVGGAYYFRTIKNTAPIQTVQQSSETPSQNETANWKTYTDQGNNFSFKYPYNWNIDESYKSVNGSIHFFKTGDKVHYTYMQAKGNEQLIVSVQTDQSFDEIQKQLNLTTPPVTIAGKKALKYATGIYILLGPSDKRVLSFYMPQYPDNGILDKILTTFESLDQNQPANVSPNGDYSVTEQTVGDKQTITIKDKDGNTIIDDLIAKNSKEIGYNVKFKCQCGTSFKKWVSNNKFSIKIVNGGGEEYEYIVDAQTGKVDEASFTRIK